MASQKIGGVAFLKVDGVQYSLRGNLKIMPLTSTRTGVAGQDGVHGTTRKPVVPYMEMDISDLGGLSVKALQAIDNSTITAELDNGKVYILVNGWYAGEAVVDSMDGKVGARFEGMDCQEQTA